MIVVSLRLAMLMPPFGSVIFGAETVWRGHQACFRVAAVDSEQTSFIPNQKVIFQLRDERGVRSRTEGVSTPSFVTESQLDVPTDIDDYAWLDVTIERPEGVDKVTVPIRSVAQPGAPQGYLSDWRDILPPRTSIFRPAQLSRVDLALYPDSGALVGGLTNRLWGRLSVDDKPYTAPIRSSALQLDGQSDSLGLFTFSYRPPPHAAPLSFSVGANANDMITVPVQARASQLLLRVHPNPWAGTHEALQVHIDALPFRDPVYVDTWVGNTLVHGETVTLQHGQADATVSLPKDVRGFVHVLAYRNLIAPAGTQSVALRFIAEEGARPAWQRAAAVLAALPGGDTRLIQALHAEPTPALLALAQSRFQPTHAGAPLLAATTQARQAAFKISQDAARHRLYVVSAVIATLGMTLATLWVVRHQRRLRREVGNVLRDAALAGEDVDPHSARAISQVRHVAYLVFTIAALAVAAYGLLAIIGRMRWN